jgi:hypothetical protein
VLEAEASEDLGYFFKRLGELCLSPASAQAFPGPASSLAVAARSGAVFFSDAQGVFDNSSDEEAAFQTEAVHNCNCLLLLKPARHTHSPPTPPAGVYACQTSTLLPRLQKWGNSDE